MTGVRYSKLRALVVGNDRHSTRVVVHILHDAGLTQCHVVDTAAAARDIFLRSQIDLIICEAALPDGEAADLVRWVRQLPMAGKKATPIIVVTGSASIADVKRARDAGATALVGKPIVPKILLERIVWCVREKPHVPEAPEPVRSYDDGLDVITISSRSGT